MPRRRWGWLVGLLVLQPGCFLLGTGNPKPPEDRSLLPSPESSRLCLSVAESLANQGHLDQAIEQLHKARRYDPKAEVSGPLARLYARKKEDRLALEEFARAVEAHPKDADLLNDRGYFHYERGNWPEAEADLRRAVELTPQNGRAWTNLGLTLGQQGKYEDSLEAFEKAVSPAEARCNLAFVLSTQGKRAEAGELYREALQMDPRLKLARAALARLDRPAREVKTAQKKESAKPTGGEDFE